MRLKFPSRSAQRSIGRLTFSGGFDSMFSAAISIGVVAVAVFQIMEPGGFTPRTSIGGFGYRVLLIVLWIANLVQMWRRGDIGWRTRRGGG